MRKTEAFGLRTKTSSRAPTRALRLSAVALGIGLLTASGVARAQDDDEGDDKTFEEKLIDNVMRGMGAVSMENSGIDYRERSPLVVPPKLDLPPPVNAKAEVNVPNWPKDADEARRKARKAANKKSKPDPWYEAARPLTPEELNKGRTAPATTKSTEHIEPGASGPTLMSPSDLGFKARFSDLFGSKTEATQFKGEPPREELTQPPPGYQTPSPNYVYGTGKQMEPVNNTHFDIVSGKEVQN
jgi:hypothetical protein